MEVEELDEETESVLELVPGVCKQCLKLLKGMVRSLKQSLIQTYFEVCLKKYCFTFSKCGTFLIIHSPVQNVFTKEIYFV